MNKKTAPKKVKERWTISTVVFKSASEAIDQIVEYKKSGLLRPETKIMKIEEIYAADITIGVSLKKK